MGPLKELVFHNLHLSRVLSLYHKDSVFSVQTDKTFMGYRTTLLVSCFILTSCQTVTISNKAVKSRDRRQAQVGSAYKRYSGIYKELCQRYSESALSAEEKTGHENRFRASPGSYSEVLFFWLISPSEKNQPH